MTAIRCISWLFVFVILGSGSTLASERSEQRSQSLGQVVDDFVLTDYLGEDYRLRDVKEPVVVLAFLGVECPLAQQYAGILQTIANRYEGRAVLWGVNSNRQDSTAEIAAYARKHGVRFPLLKDSGNRIADRLYAERTPEVIVLDKERRIRYRGRIDDQYGVGYARDKAERRDLEEAIESLLAGREIEQPLTKAIGCFIGRIGAPDENAKVTYSSHIASILYRHCAECHRDGEIAPFALTEYDEVVGWAHTIQEVIDDGRMPPWHANPAHGEFANARGMSDQEKQLIAEWVAAGAPLGDARLTPPPPPPVKIEWRTPREPDRVIQMRSKKPFVVPANGTVEYQYFVVDPGFKEDKWVSAAEVIPGNRRVVHHAIVFIKPPNPRDMRGFGWLSAYVPGQALLSFPTGLARKIPAGSQLIFQMHYTPVGSAQEDNTKIGLVFADPATVKEEAFTMLIMNREFEIPPHAANYQATASRSSFPDGSRLLAMGPHMHLRGKAFRCVYHDPDGSSRVLLDVPNYDFNWQHSYRLAEPLPLPKGGSLECIAHYDNSKNNLVNPNPAQAVRWGDQTWQEMLLGYLELAAPLESNPVDPRMERLRKEAEASADSFIARFDADGDGRVASHETPSAFSTFAFRRIDKDRDRIITRDEAFQSAMRLRRKRLQAANSP